MHRGHSNTHLGCGLCCNRYSPGSQGQVTVTIMPSAMSISNSVLLRNILSCFFLSALLKLCITSSCFTLTSDNLFESHTSIAETSLSEKEAMHCMKDNFHNTVHYSPAFYCSWIYSISFFIHYSSKSHPALFHRERSIL